MTFKVLCYSRHLKKAFQLAKNSKTNPWCWLYKVFTRGRNTTIEESIVIDSSFFVCLLFFFHLNTECTSTMKGKVHWKFHSLS